MKKFTKVWSLILSVMLGLSLTTYAQGVHEGAEPAQPKERETFNDRAGDAEVTIELEVDYWYGEASWNIYDVTSATYFYATDQTFTTGYEAVTEIVTLTIGNEYEMHVWDSFGDGGIDGWVYHEGNLLTSWDGNTSPYDYYDFGAFPFMPLPVAPSGLAGFPNPESMPGEAMIDLNWDGSGARALDSYDVYRSVAGDPFEMIGNVSGTSYTDSDVTAGTEYEYYIEAVYSEGYNSYPSEHVMVTAADAPLFAIDPESYTFEEVGILDGVPYGDPELADFSVTNEGVGTLTITEDPYFFSGQDGNFTYVGGVATPYDVGGPFDVTGESFDFQVEFAPTTAGLSSTLLVVTDDLGRVTRTFELNGSAYDIPEYDIMENAYVITQDWQVNNDFNTAMDFADFHPDYSLAPGNDVVYQFTVGIDSYFEVMENSGTFSDFAVFADGTEFTTANDLYDGTQLAIDAGTYYVVATGSGAFDFDIHIEGQEPVLVVDPTAMDLGDVPIGCWHEGGTFTVYNDGGQTITFTDATLSDENGVYTLTHDYEFPLTISTETLEFNVELNADAEGTFEAAFLLEDENTTHIYPVTGTAYTPVVGDVICDPVIAAFDGTGHFEDNNSVAAPMHDNYHIVDGYNDVVYKFSYANDFIIDIALDNAVMDPQLALYSAADVATTDPDELTPIEEGGQDILDQELLAGTYYLVVAGDQTTTPEYMLTLDVEDMPAPGAITLLTPVDGANEIPIDPTLTWELGEYTATIDVYVDTQYPPQDKVLGNADPVETFDVENLSPAQIYFWKVVAHNSNGFTESETWAFTTQLPAPLYVQGSIFDYVNVHLTWNNPFDATFKVTEDFENGEMPEGWTMTTNATGSSAGWFITDNGSSSYFSIPSHTIYAVSNDDANNGDASEDYLIMPPQDFSQWDAASLTFESFYTGDYSQSAYVEVSTDGGATYEEVYELEPNDAWTSVSVPLDDYIGEPEVYVAFHADDNGVWASGWAVDDVELAFDSNLGGGSRALIGYNVWQNGTQINDETVFVEEYDVLDLAAGDYVFGVSAVYDEGESAVTEIETITILGMSEIAGTVTDFVTGDPIESANINITGMWGEEELEYSVSTDADGNYTQVVPVTLDGYDVTASASGYVAQTEEGVMPAAAVTEVVDFALGEYPIPVSNVVAVSNDDESVATVTWDSPSGFPSYEIIYDDGIATNATAWNAGYEGNMNALKFTPSGYPCTINEAKIHIWDGTWPAGDVFNPMEIVILDDDGSGGLPGTELGSVEITPSAANWVTVDLSSLNVTIPDGEFYIANRQISTYPDCPPTAIAEGTPQNRSYAYSGGAWGTASYDCFMIRATVSGPQGTEQLGYEGDNVNVKTRANEGAVAINAADKAPGTYVEGQGTTKLVSAAPENTRAVDHYEVWRFGEDDLGTPANWTLLAEDVTVTEYDDAGFNELPWGVYYYAVKAVYPITEADFAISNMLPKDIYSNTIFMVTLNTGDVAEGVMVKLENLNDPEYVYEATTDETEQVQFEEVWKGDYLLTVAKEGYDPYFENISITETYFIKEVELIETLAAPINLTSSVNCNVVELSWEEGQGGNFEETEDFEGAFPPDGWAMETNSSVGWFQTNDGSSSFWDVPPHDSQYACSNDDAANDDGSMDYLITPEMGFTGFTAGTLTFESFYNGDYSQEAYVEISNDGGDTWSVIHTLAPSDSWEDISINLEDYLTSEYAQAWIAFHADDAGTWASGWAIDNVSIELTIGAREAENREFTGFNVYRNDVLLNTAPVTETTYTDENVPGGTHDYFIAAVYTTGQSDPSNIATVEVETINPAENLTAEKQAWDNVFLDWDPPTDQAIYTLQWDDGENFTAIGTNDVFDFAVASRWTPAELGTYDGLYLTEISFFPSEVDCEYYARVWTGADATLVAEQLVTDVTIGEWNTVQLDTPVMIDASEEFWFGYRANAQTGYPAGTDAGPAVAGYGDMIYDAESGWLSMAEAYGLDYNWNLIGTVTGGSGQQAQLAQVDETITASASEAGIGQGGINNNPVAFNMSDRALSGYNIYRDGNIIASDWPNDFYIDYDVRYHFPDPFPEDGVTFEYNVVATYDSGCEADMSNTATAYYGVDVETIGKDAIKVYPNPAKDFVNIQLTDNVETLRVINYVGQEVYSKTITDEDVIQVERLEAGAYIVRLTKNNGETITKRFVVVK